MVYYYLFDVFFLFLGFLQFKGNFVRGQNNSNCCDWAHLNHLSFLLLLISTGRDHLWKYQILLKSIVENVWITLRRIQMMNTYLFSTVHGSNEMSEPTVIGWSPPVVRTICIFVGGLVHNVHQHGALCNLRGVWSRNRFTNDGNIPVYFKRNCDCRGRYLYERSCLCYCTRFF